MKTLTLFFMLIFSGVASVAQTYKSEPIGDIDRQSDIKTLTGSGHHSGAFGAVMFKASEFKDKTFAMMGLRGGWIINRSVAIGIEVQGIIPSAKFENIDPDPDEKAILLGGYGGLFIEPVLFSNNVIHITFPIASGAGWLGYHEDWENERIRRNNELIDDDVFWYVEPGVGMEINVTRHFRMNFGVTKRFTQDLELVDTKNKDFNNLNYFLTLKIGKF
ncbi:MAG: hypothetical protein MI921_25820 [Cytophagales bacterium]|nr:hypothetical protein [Cytophagales bacterium]